MNKNEAALALHPMHQALMAHHHHLKNFHIGSMQVGHMTGTQGAWVILIGLFLVAAVIGVSVLRRSS
jgi:hypothetical protein